MALTRAMLRVTRPVSCFMRRAGASSSSESSATPSPPTTTTDDDLVSRMSQQDYFQLFRLEQSYDIDQRLLKQRFTEMQMLFHPDKFSSAGDHQTSEMSAETAERLSSRINGAFKVLSDGHERGLYLLRVHGHEVREDESGVQLSPDFLSEMMSLNEEVDEAIGNEGQLQVLLQRNRESQSDIQSALSAAFRRQDFEECRRLLIRLKFYRSLEHSIKEKVA